MSDLELRKWAMELVLTHGIYPVGGRMHNAILQAEELLRWVEHEVLEEAHRVVSDEPPPEVSGGLG